MELTEKTPWGWADGNLHLQLPLWDSPRQTSSTISWAGFFLQWCPTGAQGPGLTQKALSLATWPEVEKPALCLTLISQALSGTIYHRDSSLGRIHQESLLECSED